MQLIAVTIPLTVLGLCNKEISIRASNETEIPPSRIITNNIMLVCIPSQCIIPTSHY